MEVAILYEDESFIAINKPAGLMMHSDGRGSGKTLVDWILEHYPDIRGVGEPQLLQSGETIERPGIVHRLDRDTSGILLIAKTQEMFLHLKAQFQNMTLEKEYRAFVEGQLKENSYTLTFPIGRSASDFRKWSAQRGARGKLREATTVVSVLGRSSSASYVSVMPKTGRTHQIRVHMKALHHPVMCDTLYGFKTSICPPELGRLALHSFSLSFSLLSHERMTLECPLPESFVAFKEAQGL